jgi:hypothetical protein
LICQRCGKEYNRKDYLNFIGTKSSVCCRKCAEESQLLYAQNLINRVKAIYKKSKKLKYSIEQELHFQLCRSRNDIRSFGYSLGIHSWESNNKTTTLDHINGMNSIIINCALNIVNGNISTPEQVIDYLNLKSCTIRISKKLNQKLRSYRPITPRTYYLLCESIYKKEEKLSFKTFLKEYERFFI